MPIPNVFSIDAKVFMVRSLDRHPYADPMFGAVFTGSNDDATTQSIRGRSSRMKTT